MIRRSAVLALAALLLPMAAVAQDAVKQSDEMVEIRAAALTWSPLEVPGFKPGMQVAVLHGDPASAGTYTIRLRFPAGYGFPGHSHPNAENLTVLSGKFHLGMGATTDLRQLKTYAPGDYLNIPGGMPHFGRVEVETVIQLHGTGPFSITVTEK